MPSQNSPTTAACIVAIICIVNYAYAAYAQCLLTSIMRQAPVATAISVSLHTVNLIVGVHSYSLQSAMFMIDIIAKLNLLKICKKYGKKFIYISASVLIKIMRIRMTSSWLINNYMQSLILL